MYIILADIEADEKNQENILVARQYASGEGPFQERGAVVSVIGRFWRDYVDMVGTWATWATEVVEGWPDDLTRADPAWGPTDETARRRLPTDPDDWPAPG